MKFIETITYPFSESLYFIADIFNGNYGLAVIAITLIIRLVLFPLFVKQAKQQKEMHVIKQAMKTELDMLQEKYKDRKKPEDKKKQQEETINLYKKHNIDPLSMGCLPMLIQIPIVMGMYRAVIETSALSNHHFWVFDFAHSSLLLACIAGLIYYFQGRFSQDAASTQSNMKWMLLLSPISIFVFSITSPAILPFYWAINGVLLCIQSLLIKKII
ncbi:membrane protein insertase YidC [Fictibacillus barbaricus]|uniref:YidC/Oxa1 family membrane protein insertase n=1 Tax=Fictibacillus barbaricus TaxID=182136 RepID=A0ABU1U1H7_9BACL|nr:membrane protein insertase YidC [Fictibacillus barbaricus]MDR7073343.1 YidC/Oxa1 family membrane protein insertase [Fictibacillus barbaricus]